MYHVVYHKDKGSTFLEGDNFLPGSIVPHPRRQSS